MWFNNILNIIKHKVVNDIFAFMVQIYLPSLLGKRGVMGGPLEAPLHFLGTIVLWCSRGALRRLVVVVFPVWLCCTFCVNKLPLCAFNRNMLDKCNLYYCAIHFDPSRSFGSIYVIFIVCKLFSQETQRRDKTCAFFPLPLYTSHYYTYDDLLC